MFPHTIYYLWHFRCRLSGLHSCPLTSSPQPNFGQDMPLQGTRARPASHSHAHDPSTHHTTPVWAVTNLASPSPIFPCGAKPTWTRNWTFGWEFQMSTTACCVRAHRTDATAADKSRWSLVGTASNSLSTCRYPMVCLDLDQKRRQCSNMGRRGAPLERQQPVMLDGHGACSPPDPSLMRPPCLSNYLPRPPYTPLRANATQTFSNSLPFQPSTLLSVRRLYLSWGR
ncbi:hypothetical protein LY76DRAFT_285421 [Colletotrichum caudatum]|nr:hypothetical protein LY76DRAFT_285421 [Colletotrichum caudatum]